MHSNKIPVHIITGFLGAGKTTAILHLLQTKRKDEQWAVIVNEFGKVSIDFETLSPQASSNEKVFEISGGCICCSAKDYFGENLNEIVDQHKYDRIIIEPSGLGGVEMVSENIERNPELSLMPVICLADVSLLQNSRIQQIMIYQSQLRNADIVVLSKCDLLHSEAEINHHLETVQEKYPNKAAYLFSKNSSFPTNILSIKKNEFHKEEDFSWVHFSTIELSDNNYRQHAISLEKDKVFDLNKLTEFFESEGTIIRAKGFVRTSNGWISFHSVLNSFSYNMCDEKAQNQIVIIQQKPEKETGVNLDINNQLVKTLLD
jgi:G3E family GTPase